MGKRLSLPENTLTNAAGWMVPILLYIALLTPLIPYSLNSFFEAYSFPLFLVLLAVYYASFKRPGRRYEVLAASVTMAIFALKLSSLWASGYSDNAVIGGLLPNKDGFHYFGGASLMLEGELLPKYTLQAAMRPLFPGFLSTLLLLTSQNLQYALAILAGLTAVCCHSAGRAVKRLAGPAGAAAFMSLTYLYIQPLIGDTVTELLGLALGCLGFVILLAAARSLKFGHMAAGMLVLAAAVSVRPGTFFIFPLLVLWVGRVFPAPRKRSLYLMGGMAATGLAALLLLNPVFNRAVVQPGTPSNGNFAYTMYGQVMGGVGFHRAVQIYGRDPALIYQVTWDEFLGHPWSLALATLKSYRDFFLPGRIGVFSFDSPGSLLWLDMALWAAAMLFLGRGLFISWKKRASPLYSLLALAFAGIVLSIPFLPPIDGGRRFYASTMPFFFALPALAAGEWLVPKGSQKAETRAPNPWFAFGGAMAMAAAATLVPLGMQHIPQPADVEAPACSKGETPFAVRFSAGTYIDIAAKSSEACGFVPEVCWGDFEANAVDKKVEPFTQSLIDASAASESGLRIFPGNDLLIRGVFYYIGESDDFDGIPAPSVIYGCGRPDYANEAYYVGSIEGFLPVP